MIGIRYSLYSDESLRMKREGFSRKLFAVQPVAQGTVARVKVRKKDVVAWQISTDVKIQESKVVQTYVYPPSFYLAGMIMIGDKEIQQASTDLLDEKYN